jgi:hypothetical protein
MRAPGDDRQFREARADSRKGPVGQERCHRGIGEAVEIGAQALDGIQVMLEVALALEILERDPLSGKALPGAADEVENPELGYEASKACSRPGGSADSILMG